MNVSYFFTFYLQADQQKMHDFREVIEKLSDPKVDPKFYIFWGYAVTYVEDTMSFYPNSKALEFLLFCNGSLPVSDDDIDNDRGNDKTTQPVTNTLEIETTTDANRTTYGNIAGSTNGKYDNQTLF